MKYTVKQRVTLIGIGNGRIARVCLECESVRRGLTLVELLIYIAIAFFVFTVIFARFHFNHHH